MNKKTIILFFILGVFFYLFSIVEMSFFPFYNVFIFKISLSLVIPILICLFEEPEKLLGVYAAFWAGFFADTLSFSMYYGIMTITMVLAAFLIKLILLKYVRVPSSAWLSKIQG
ncbi:MAG: hypothetical protein WC520_03715 [Candidatus Paceibacterota bacterium]